jgi:hypothetical protein
MSVTPLKCVLYRCDLESALCPTKPAIQEPLTLASNFFEVRPPSGNYTVSLFNFTAQFPTRISTNMLAIRMRPAIGTSNASQFTRGSEEMGCFLPTREARV